MTDRDPHEPFDFDDYVAVLGGKARGFVSGITFYNDAEPAYRIAYYDDSGAPHERWWRHSQLTLIRAAEGDEAEVEDNVVPLRRVVN